MKKKSVLDRLRRHKEQLMSLGVSRLGLFGSTVREENTPLSDIDILIDFQDGKETFSNYISVCDRLEMLFKRAKLDVVTVKGLSPYIGKQILREVEYV